MYIFSLGIEINYHLNSIGHVRKKLLKQPNLQKFYRLHRDSDHATDEVLGDESTPLVR